MTMLAIGPAINADLSSLSKSITSPITALSAKSTNTASGKTLRCEMELQQVQDCAYIARGLT